MIIDIHTHCKQIKDYSVFNAFLEKTDVVCSYGIHPWYAEQFTWENFLLLEKLVQQENCVAIGECGLDKNTTVDWSIQTACFEAQIQLSEKFQKPLIIHCVKAIQELILLKRRFQPKQPWIFHGFRKTGVLQQLLDEGFYISIGHALFIDNQLQEAVKHLSLQQLFLETDDKEFPIFQLYEKVAEIKDVALSEVEKQIEMNFRKMIHHN
ncbi:MAG: TatD family hydrolase [Crocinitomicaceae bacterium]|nr:TatD family hydrolase [Crocinitomicaceae bacterium]